MVAMMQKISATMNAARLIRKNVMNDRIEPATWMIVNRIEKFSASVVTCLRNGLRSL